MPVSFEFSCSSRCVILKYMNTLLTSSLLFSDDIAVNTKCITRLETRYLATPAVIWNKSKMAIYHEGQISSTVTKLPDEMTRISAVSVSYFGVEAVLRNATDSMWFAYDNNTNAFINGEL